MACSRSLEKCRAARVYQPCTSAGARDADTGFTEQLVGLILQALPGWKCNSHAHGCTSKCNVVLSLPQWDQADNKTPSQEGIEFKRIELNPLS